MPRHDDGQARELLFSPYLYRTATAAVATWRCDHAPYLPIVGDGDVDLTLGPREVPVVKETVPLGTKGKKASGTYVIYVTTRREDYLHRSTYTKSLAHPSQALHRSLATRT